MAPDRPVDVKPLSASLVLSLLLAGPPSAQEPDQEAAQAAGERTPEGSAGQAIREDLATPAERLKLADGFRAELLYSVPIAEQGSWINLCADDAGRIIASDQYGGLYRFPAPPPGQPLDPADIERVPVDVRAVMGMAWAFGALYVAVNDYENRMESGLYRLTDSDGDDRLDQVQQLRSMQGYRPHGIHGVLPTPDDEGLYVVTGNGFRPTAFTSSRVPLHWGEDHLLPRLPDGRGFMRGVLAPGGIVYRVSPGGDFEIHASGFRNPFDAAVNHDGELFTADADMEYDFNTSWYRPTRICHVVSGSEYGWRNGAGKWPEWYPDNLPPVLNIGPGSPTGMTFGYGARFPARYQEVLFVLDWSLGRINAVRLQPKGASYTAVLEPFLSGAPLPVVDAIIHPADGAMYFVTGGRRLQSGLYRLTYAGPESTEPVPPSISAGQRERDLRHELEAFHGRRDPRAVDTAWPYLGHGDRFIRWAARVAIEHQPASEWSERALAETDAGRRLEALLALARVGGIDPLHRRRRDPPVDEALRGRILASLDELDWGRLDQERRIELVRVYEIVLNRYGRPDDATVSRLIARLDPLFPADTRELNWLLCETLCYLQSPTAAAKGIALIQDAPTQEEQIEYARSLRVLKVGWTKELRTAWFRWLLKAVNYSGGSSFERVLQFIRNDSLATLSDAEREELQPLLAERPAEKSTLEALSSIFVGRETTDWKLDDLSAAARDGLRNRDFADGRKMFGATGCFACHRFGNEGGMTGPDITNAGSRYSPRDLLEQILEPSKEINEQFVPVEVVTDDDDVYCGTIVDLNRETIFLNTDPADPNRQVRIPRQRVVSIGPSKLSPMPEGLLAPLTKDEILDLLAYVLSGGDARNEMFEQ